MIGFLVAAVLALVALRLLVLLLEPRMAFFPTRGEDVTPAALGLRYHARTVTTSDGESLRVWRIPHRRPVASVVYFHGNGGNLSLWAPVLAGLHARGLDVVALDYRGYGLSTGSPSERGLYRDAEAVVRQLRPAADAGVPLVYWGRSLGAAAAAHAATVVPPDGLILEAAFPDARSVLRHSPVLAVLGLFSTYRFPIAELASRFAGPVLVIHGDADTVVPASEGRRLHDRLPEPKRFLRVRGGDHNDDPPADPERYWSGVLAFLAELRAGAAQTPGCPGGDAAEG